MRRTDGSLVEVGKSCSIGRTAQSTLRIDDRSVSRRHAMINCDEAGAYWLVDFGSSNGVLHNGLRIKQPAQLRDGDHFEIGENRFMFFQGELPEAVAEDQQETTSMTVSSVKTVPIWILVADVVNSTSLTTSHSVEEATGSMADWFKTCQALLRKHSAEINKHLGDGFLAYWPSPQAPPSIVLTAIRELKNLQQTHPLHFRFVVHHGRVMVDSSVSRGEDSLLGPEVNFAFRMEKLAGALQVPCLISRPAAGLLEPSSELVSRGLHAVASFEGEHEFFVL